MNRRHKGLLLAMVAVAGCSGGPVVPAEGSLLGTWKATSIRSIPDDREFIGPDLSYRVTFFGDAKGGTYLAVEGPGWKNFSTHSDRWYRESTTSLNWYVGGFPRFCRITERADESITISCVIRVYDLVRD